MILDRVNALDSVSILAGSRHSVLANADSFCGTKNEQIASSARSHRVGPEPIPVPPENHRNSRSFAPPQFRAQGVAFGS